MWPGIAFVGSTEVGLSMTRTAARARVKAEAKAAKSSASVARSKARRIARANPNVSGAELARRSGLSAPAARKVKADLLVPDTA
jgi:hypothetical protein